MSPRMNTVARRLVRLSSGQKTERKSHLFPARPVDTIPFAARVSTNPAEENGYRSVMDDLVGHASQNELGEPAASVSGHGDQVEIAISGVLDDFLGIVAVSNYGIDLHSHTFQVALNFGQVFFGFPDDVHLMLNGIRPGKGMRQGHPQKGNLTVMDFGQPFHSRQNSFGQFGAVQGNQNF